MTNRVLKSGFIQHRWVQKIRECAYFADALVRQSLTIGSEFAQLPSGGRNGSTELTENGCQSDEILARGIVQVSGDTTPLLVLQTQELTGEATQLLLDPHRFGDVSASAGNTSRLSFLIMKSLPAFLENFDAAIRHYDPICDRGRRALVERRYKSCIHFRAVLRMNEFAELWTSGTETRRIGLKDAVCLL